MKLIQWYLFVVWIVLAAVASAGVLITGIWILGRIFL